MHLFISTRRVIKEGTLRAGFLQNDLFGAFLHYHGLVFLHRQKGVPFADHKSCAAYYHRCVTSSYWRSLRRRRFSDQNWICAAPYCSKMPRDLHHRNYLCLGREKLCDVEGYCFRCHRQLHYSLRFPTIAEKFEQLDLTFRCNDLVA